MVENGTDAILGAEPFALQFAHLGSSALALRLNRVDMRVLRRIAGCINGVDTDGVGQPHHSNRAVRQMLGEPSIDCIPARARPKYWRRVMT